MPSSSRAFDFLPLPPPEPGLGGGPVSPNGTFPPTSTPIGSASPSRSTSPLQRIQSSASYHAPTAASSTAVSVPSRGRPDSRASGHGSGNGNGHSNSHGNGVSPAKRREAEETADNQELDELIFQEFTYETAWDVGCHLRETFLERQHRAGMIQVVMMSGLVAFQAIVGDARRLGTSHMRQAQEHFERVRSTAKPSCQRNEESFTINLNRSVRDVAGPTDEEGIGVPFFIQNCPLAPFGAIIITGVPPDDCEKVGFILH